MVPASLRCRATSRPEPRSRPPCGGPRRLLASCCLPSAACYLSPAACCLPPSVYCLTPVARCLPSAATAKCQTRPPPADHCLAPVVCHHGRPPSAAPAERRTSPPATTRTLPPIRLIDATIGIAPAPLSDMPPTIPLAIPCGLTPATTHKPKPQNFNDLSSDFEIHSGELHAKLLPARPRQQPNRYKTLPTRPQTPISARFARAGRTLYRSHHHDPQQGELCTAPSAKPGTKLSQRPRSTAVPRKSSPSTPHTTTEPRKSSPSTPKNGVFRLFRACRANFFAHKQATSHAGRIISRTGDRTGSADEGRMR